MIANITAERLKKEIESLQRQIDSKQGELNSIYSLCSHDWEQQPNTYETQKGYRWAAEQHGSDYYPEVNVPDKTKTIYHRRCKICGKIESTDLVATVQQPTITKPKW